MLAQILTGHAGQTGTCRDSCPAPPPDRTGHTPLRGVPVSRVPVKRDRGPVRGRWQASQTMEGTGAAAA
jgi:hypothetical protein